MDWFNGSLAISSIVFIVILGSTAMGGPFGIAGNTGPSMGDESMTVNIWIDSEPDVGDVIVYDPGDVLKHDMAVHRIVDDTGDGYVTKGDANEYTDQEIGAVYATQDNTYGVVVYRFSIIPIIYLGIVVSLLGSIIIFQNIKSGEFSLSLQQ